MTDPESVWFHKGEHKQVFAYNAQVACDKHGWALAYSVTAGNVMIVKLFQLFLLNSKPLNQPT